MKIKHIESEIETSIEFGKWIREYVRKGIYKKWGVVSLNGVYKVHTVIDNGESVITLMSSSDATKHKNQYNSKVRVSKEKVSIEFYNNYIDNRILKKNQSDFEKSSFLKRLSKRIEQIIKPKKNPNEIPFTRAESVQIKIGVWSIVITIVLFVIGKYFI